jgi:hypothetical protein
MAACRLYVDLGHVPPGLSVAPRVRSAWEGDAVAGRGVRCAQQLEVVAVPFGAPLQPPPKDFPVLVPARPPQRVAY